MVIVVSGVLERTTARHIEQPPLARMLVRSSAQILKESCVQTHRHVEVQSMIVFTEIMGVRGSMCPYIPTKGTVVQVVMSTDNPTVKTIIRVRANVYDKYGRY